MTTVLAIHAFQITNGRKTPVWRSDAWLNTGTPNRHLTIAVCTEPTQLDLFGATA